MGSYADVYLGWEKTPAKEVCAIKAVRMKQRIGIDECTKLLKEVGVMRRMGQHASIVNCNGALFDPRGLLCIVMEYVKGGTLRAYVKSRPRLSSLSAARTIKQVTEALAYLHKYKIYHRDLKGENILVARVAACGTPVVKIADFGNSKAKLGNTMASAGGSVADTFAGTVIWMAPETIREVSYSSSRADVWSLGVVACEVLNQGKTPWPAFESQFQLVYHIAQWRGGENGGDIPPAVPADVDAECSEFLHNALRYEPSERISAHKLLSLSYIQNAGSPDADDMPGEEIVVDAKPRGYSRLYPVHSPSELHSLCVFASDRKEQELAYAGDATSMTIQTLQTTASLCTPPATPPTADLKEGHWDPNN